jgi:hypothetical protein
MSVRGNDMTQAWINNKNTHELLDAISEGLPPSRAATAAHIRGGLTFGHVYALVGILIGKKASNPGMRNKGLTLLRWVLYLSNPPEIPEDILSMSLPTAASTASKALWARCTRMVGTHKARSAIIAKRVDCAMRRGNHAEKDKELRELAQLNEVFIEPFHLEMTDYIQNISTDAATSGGRGGDGRGTCQAASDAGERVGVEKESSQRATDDVSSLQQDGISRTCLAPAPTGSEGSLSGRSEMQQLRHLVAQLLQEKQSAIAERDALQVELNLAGRRTRVQLAEAITTTRQQALHQLRAHAEAMGEARAREEVAALSAAANERMQEAQATLRDAEARLSEAQQLEEKSSVELVAELAAMESLKARIARLECGRNGGALVEIERLRARNRELDKRRTLNQKRVQDANLEKARTKSAVARSNCLQAALQSRWDAETSPNVAKLQATIAELTVSTSTAHLFLRRTLS